MRRLLFALVLAGCSSNALHKPLAGPACAGNNDCAKGSWCAGLLHSCAGGPGVAVLGAGTCHPDCSDGHCACVDPADCGPGRSCVAGLCQSPPGTCTPPSCSPSCPATHDDSGCTVCRCSSCPPTQPSCMTNADCGHGSYCAGVSQACPGAAGLVVEGTGTCHEDCRDGHCACQSDADCGPGPSRCDQGRCSAGGVLCGDPGCPVACPLTAVPDSPCPVCLCSTCPTSGASCKTNSDCGVGHYCAGVSTQCPGQPDLVVEGTGRCHVNCTDGHCACQSDADCGPGPSVCNAGKCFGAGGACRIVSCPAACPMGTPPDEGCPVCVCATCPA